MDKRPLGSTSLAVTPVGFGAFKIGRDQGAKYPTGYTLPTEDQAVAIVHRMIDLGINYIDTAPAYGLSEHRVGKALAQASTSEIVVSTKVGETFTAGSDGRPGKSVYAFDAESIRRSIDRSRRMLGRDTLDIVFIHSNGDDLHILDQTDTAETLIALRDAGVIRAIGLSGKTPQGFERTFDWADVAMVEFSPAAPELAATIHAAADKGLGVVVKKALGSGHLSADEALGFVFKQPGVCSAVVGTLSADHMRANIASVRAAL